MRKFRIIALIVLAALVLPSFTSSQDVPSPQSLMVTLTGYRDANNALKCKLYYMVTLPSDPSAIKNIHITLDKPVGDLEKENVSDLVIPFDWNAAQKVDGVVSFYTTRNILYIGIGEYDLLRRYECKIAFMDDKGNKSRYAIFKK